MEIIQINPGLISIPPNGWGAIEKIIWEYKKGLDKLGVQTHIRYLNQCIDSKSEIIHLHVANLAIEAKRLGIPYIFSLHDHHVVHYGKDSINYKQNLDAIKGSIISICHAEYLIDYFEETDKLFYLSHGVDIDFFKSDGREKPEHRLLCLANNGLGGDSTFDRKGFRPAIEAARKLNLEITIAGPENNLEFFKSHEDLLDYDKLNIISTNPNDEEIKELYNSHTIFLHPSTLEAGHPNLTLLEALSSSIPVVGTYKGTQPLSGMLVIKNTSTEEVVYGINSVIEHYDRYVEETKKLRETHSWDVITKRLLSMYETVTNIKKPYTSEDTKKLYSEEYGNNDIVITKQKDDLTFKYNFIDGPFFEVFGKNTDKKYAVVFTDDNGMVHYKEDITANMWVKLNRKYYTKWNIKLYDRNEIVFDYTLSYQNRRVYIAFDSSSLGDNIAWIPYIEEFRKKHNCTVICSTFKNDLFKDIYTDIEFVEPGTVVHDIHGMYKIGWFYNTNMEPELPNTIPLQKAITNILGLDFSEKRAYVKPHITKRPIKDKYVTIGTTSTAQLKYWNYPDGWKILTKKLIDMGYKVLNVSKENIWLPGVRELPDKSLPSTINAIHHSEFFIGLSSGLSWLSWAIGKKVVMISNFSKPDHEFTTNCYRITNPDVCNGCWNSPMFKFDKGDWNWCPEFKNTERQFECHKSITPEMVMESINKLISEN